MYGVLLFKQKTAYEMRMSDWSSDVCSSDLPLRRASPRGTAAPGGDSCLSRGAWLTPLRHAVSTRRRVRKVPVLHAADHGGCSFGNPGCVCIGRLVCEIGRASCRERVCQYV